MRWTLLLLLAPACTPLAGEWEGLLTCGDVEQQVQLELAWDADRYRGDGDLWFDGQAGGFDTVITVQFDLEVAAEVGAGGVLAVQADSTRCSYRSGEDELEATCVTDLDDGNEFSWNGADRIEVAGACTGGLDRGGDAL